MPNPRNKVAIDHEPPPSATAATLPLAQYPGAGGIEQALMTGAAADGAAPQAEVTPEAAGRYEWRSEHARGGQARVMRTYDRHLDREIAWKELLPDGDGSVPSEGLASSQSLIARFVREARITGSLQHPNIVPIHELGRRGDGTLYYTMRLVRGQTMTEKLAHCSGLSDRLKLLDSFWDLCNAIAYAHSQGVVHRDLKPDNVMVGEFGETVVLDWGLAKVRGAEELRDAQTQPPGAAIQSNAVDRTLAGTALGTPAYMSPEQASGNVGEIDERSDVWGLGAVLYEIIAGRAPFEGRSILDLLTKVRTQPPRPASELEPTAPPELVAIAAKALQADKARRYADAKQLADDVAAYMKGARVRAHEYSSWELLRRFAKRNKVLIAATAAVWIVILAALAVIAYDYRQLKTARARESIEHQHAHFNLAQAHARQAQRLLSQQFYLSARIYAAASLLNNPAHPGPAFAEGFDATEPDSQPLRVEAESFAYRCGLRRVRSLSASFTTEAEVSAMGASSDAVRVVTGDIHGGLTTIDLASGTQRKLAVGLKDRICAVRFSRDGQRLLTASADGAASIWLPDMSAPAVSFHDSLGSFSSAAFSPNRDWVVTGSRDGRVQRWDASSGQVQWAIAHHRDKASSVEFSPDGDVVAVASWDKTGSILDARSGKLVHTLEGHRGSIYSVAFSPDSKRLVTTSWDKTARIWEVASGQVLSLLEGAENPLTAAVWSADGSTIATADMNGNVQLWNPASGRMTEAVQLGGSAVASIALSADGRRLIAAQTSRRVTAWTLEPSDGLQRLNHPDFVSDIAFSRDGAMTATGCEDRVVRLWDTATGAKRGELSGFTAPVTAVAISPDRRRLAVGLQDGSVRDGDIAGGVSERSLGRHEGQVNSVVYASDGSWLASAGSRDHQVLLYDLGLGQRVAQLQHEDIAFSVALSPDNRLAAVASADKRVWIWDVPTRSVVASLTGHADRVVSVSFSPDGKWLVSSGRDGEVIVWNVSQRALARSLHVHKQWVSDARFSPDNTWLVTAGDDRRAVLWNVSAGLPWLSLGTSTPVGFARFMPGGHSVAVHENETVVIYPLGRGQTQLDAQRLLDDAQREAGLKLSGFDLTVPSAR